MGSTSYIKAFNADEDDLFGWNGAISEDGNLVVIAARGEDSGEFGINQSGLDNSAPNSGAVYAFRFDALSSSWIQEAYFKAPFATTLFGDGLALSGDGNTIAISDFSGNIFIYRYATTWSLADQFTVTAIGRPYTDASLSLSHDGTKLTVSIDTDVDGEPGIDGVATGVITRLPGKTVLYSYNGTAWVIQNELKPIVLEANDAFSQAKITPSGDRVIIFSIREDSSSSIINEGYLDNSLNNAGAVLLY